LSESSYTHWRSAAFCVHHNPTCTRQERISPDHLQILGLLQLFRILSWVGVHDSSLQTDSQSNFTVPWTTRPLCQLQSPGGADVPTVYSR